MSTGPAMFTAAVPVLHVSDASAADRLHGELLERGVAIDMPPTDQTWGNREMYLRDLDGNRIRFVQQETK